MKDLDNLLEGIMDVDFDLTEEDISLEVVRSVLSTHKCRFENISWPGRFELLTVDGTNASIITEIGSNGLSILSSPDIPKALKKRDTIAIIYPRKSQQQAVEILYNINGRIWAWPANRYMKEDGFEGYRDYDEYVASLEYKSGGNGWRRLSRVAKAINLGQSTEFEIQNKFEPLVK